MNENGRRIHKTKIKWTAIEKDFTRVLVDGSVVPCCLDHAGNIVLGNLFESSLDEILVSPRAKAIYDGFTNHEAVEPLCKRCGYAIITKQYRK